MSLVGSQQQTFLRLLRFLQPHWRRDPALPTRIQSLLAQHKEFGSRDRKLYRELIYTVIRYLPWIEPLLDADPDRAVRMTSWLAAPARETQRFKAETSGDWPALSSLSERAHFLQREVNELLPNWFRSEAPFVYEPTELDVQLQRAPLWLRLQTADAPSVAAEFSAKGLAWAPSNVLPTAWRLLTDADVTKTDAYQTGRIEVQDLGSQLLLETIGIEPGGAWLDACAGAGGKTLQLAALAGPTGRVDAADIRPAALDELRQRVSRAGFSNVRTVAPGQSVAYDGVLVDAPCSGSGTWRRSPHLKWITSAQVVTDRADLQSRLLDRYARNVRAGGRLVYATCSLARTENETVVRGFLQQHPEYAIEPFARTFGFEPGGEGLCVRPALYNTDGFFVASLRRIA